MNSAYQQTAQRTAKKSNHMENRPIKDSEC